MLKVLCHYFSFKDPRYTIVFMIPHAGTDVSSLLENVNEKNLFKAFKNFVQEDINLSMPRTAIEFSNDLVEILKKVILIDTQITFAAYRITSIKNCLQK